MGEQVLVYCSCARGLTGNCRPEAIYYDETV